MRVERVDFVDIPSRDVERSIAFYRDVLGLPQNPHDPTELEAGNVTLAIWKPQDQGVEFPKSAAHGIALRVPDVAEARAELEAKGVEFIGPVQSDPHSGNRWSHFRAPDGYVYEICRVAKLA
jgi:catechol 2,3-dioxygenase-like lactoylglutathione lyase family enzyme